MSSSHQEASERPVSRHSGHSGGSKRSKASIASEETTPLLSRQDDDEPVSYSGPTNGAVSPAAASLQSIQDNFEGSGKGQRKWATLVSLSILSALMVTILCLGFAAPAIVEEYAKEALVLEPTSLSIDSFTATGVRARIQGNFVLDGSRVQKKSVRDLGRVGTWIAKEVESEESMVKVYLPEYSNLLLGTAIVPPIKVSIRDGHYTHFDFLADLEPGNVDGIRRIVKDWLDGRLGSLAVKGVASVALKSGIFKLGTQTLSQSMLFKGEPLPTAIRFHEDSNVGLTFPNRPRHSRLSCIRYSETQLHRVWTAG
jgi:hypothetical protein